MTVNAYKALYRFLVRLRGWLNVLIAAARARAYPKLAQHRPEQVEQVP